MGPLETVLEKVGRVLSDQFGIRIVCRGNRCCTNGRTIFLPALPDNVPDDLLQAIRGLCDHESAHLRFNSSFPVGTRFRKQFGDDAFGLLNILEDARVEAAMSRQYPGSAKNLENAYVFAVDRVAETIRSGEKISSMRQLAFAVHTRVHGKPELPFVEPRIRAAADDIRPEIRKAITAPDTKTVAKLAESAWRKIQGVLTQPTPPSLGDPDAQDPGDASPRTGRSSPEDKTGRSTTPPATIEADDDQDIPSGNVRNAGPSGSHDPGSYRKQDGTASGGAGTAEATMPAVPNPAVGAAAISLEGRPGEENGLIGNIGQDLVGAISSYAATTKQYQVWSTEYDTVRVPDTDSPISHAERMAPLLRHVAGVRQRLLQSLLAEVRSRWLPGQDTGRLDPRALHRIAAAHWIQTRPDNNTDTSAMIRRVFRKRAVTRRLETAVTLLVDQSHSMNGRKIALARETALVLCEALSRLSIPTSVIGFSTQHASLVLKEAVRETGLSANTLEEQYRFAPLIHERFLCFGETFRKVSGRFDRLGTHMLTPLGESMLFAARELASRSEPRKVLLVLTDGRPTVGMGQDFATFRHAKDSIVRIEKAGIDVALVGIVEQCVHDLHHRAVVVNELDDLPRTVMTQLRQMLAAHQPRTLYRHAGQSPTSA